jgi:hypothetical protein
MGLGCEVDIAHTGSFSVWAWFLGSLTFAVVAGDCSIGRDAGKRIGGIGGVGGGVSGISPANRIEGLRGCIPYTPSFAFTSPCL